MQRFECISDIGSILVGNEEFGVALPNIGGDGLTILTIYDTEAECDLDCKLRKTSLRFITCLEGTFNIYNYDCSTRKKEDIIATISGRYGIWQGNMEVALVKWE